MQNYVYISLRNCHIILRGEWGRSPRTINVCKPILPGQEMRVDFW